MKPAALCEPLELIELDPEQVEVGARSTNYRAQFIQYGRTQVIACLLRLNIIRPFATADKYKLAARQVTVFSPVNHHRSGDLDEKQTRTTTKSRQETNDEIN